MSSTSTLPYLMVPPHTLLRDEHYVVTLGKGSTDRVVFGRYLPLTKRAATQYSRTHGGRVIKRTTARKSGLL